jgi:hypothetical protein
MPKYRILVRETYVMTHEAETPADAGRLALKCMYDHRDSHVVMQEVRLLPDDEEDFEWGDYPQSNEMH